MKLGRRLEGLKGGLELENVFRHSYYLCFPFLLHLQGLQMVRHCGCLWVTQKHTLSLRFVSVPRSLWAADVVDRFVEVGRGEVGRGEER